MLGKGLLPSFPLFKQKVPCRLPRQIRKEVSRAELLAFAFRHFLISRQIKKNYGETQGRPLSSSVVFFFTSSICYRHLREPQKGTGEGGRATRGERTSLIDGRGWTVEKQRSLCLHRGKRGCFRERVLFHQFQLLFFSVLPWESLLDFSHA